MRILTSCRQFYHKMKQIMTATMQLRAYRSTDFDDCLAIFTSNMPKYFLEHERAEFAQFIQTTTTPYFVVTQSHVATAQEGTTVIGCGGYFLHGDQSSAGLSWGMVADAYHKTGAGRFLLMERLQRICQETSAQRVLLNTSQHTFGFFAKVGFVVDNVTKDGFGPGLDDYAMSLQLHPLWCADHGYGAA